MNWRDLFYFSKGERRALTVLLLLISLSWFTLQLKDNTVENAAPAETATSNATPSPSQTQADKPKPYNRVASPYKPSGYSSRKKSGFLRETDKTPSERDPFHNRKFPEGTIVELNAADTITLKKVPGIGSTFARRIVKFRDLLGGFCSVGQLAEVYGIDEERHEAMIRWFSVDTSAIRRLALNRLTAKELSKHPYISYRQARVIEQLVKQKGKLSGWENLQLLEEFSEADKERLAPYLSFE